MQLNNNSTCIGIVSLDVQYNTVSTVFWSMIKLAQTSQIWTISFPVSTVYWFSIVKKKKYDPKKMIQYMIWWEKNCSLFLLYTIDSWSYQNYFIPMSSSLQYNCLFVYIAWKCCRKGREQGSHDQMQWVPGRNIPPSSELSNSFFCTFRHKVK